MVWRKVLAVAAAAGLGVLMAGSPAWGAERSQVEVTVTSAVHLDGTHAVLDNSNWATAPADVHDSVVVTVTDLTEWFGEVNVYFYTNGDCDGDFADQSGDILIDQDTTMPLENLLPQSGLAAGHYSYSSISAIATPGTPPVVGEGPCEPFTVFADATLTSAVHLDNTHAVIDTSNPGTAPADVHDSVVLTIPDVDEWTGDVIMFFYENGDCAGDPADETTQGDLPVNQDTPMPLEDLLPQSDLPAGDYSYRSVFVTGNPALPAITYGACEPFKIKEQLAKTGITVGDVGVGAIALTGLALVAGGALLLVFFRRRKTLTQ